MESGMLQRNVLCSLVLFAFVASAGVVRASAAKGATIAGQDALGVATTWSEVKRLPGGSDFWPVLPQFNLGLEAGPLPVAEAVQMYDYAGPDAERAGAEIDSTVVVLANSAQAQAAYARYSRVDDRGRTITGPRVDANQWRYSRKTSGKLTELTLRWRIGTAVGRIALIDRIPWTANTLAGLFRPVSQRTRALLTGHLHTPALSASEAALLPSSSAAPWRVVGTTSVPAEAWAMEDSSHKPQQTLRTLQRDGLGAMLTRTYRPGNVPQNDVSVVLFRFASPAGANSWVQSFINDAKRKGGLHPGRTGKHSAFEEGSKGSFYELQFARGPFAGDVFCAAPFGRTSSACEGITRRLAERWYTTLPHR